MKPDERELKFDRLRIITKRIIAAKHYLFIGEPYKSAMKPNKYKTFITLCKMLDKNIKDVGALFTN